MCSKPQQVIHDSGNFVEHYPNILRPHWHFESKQFFDGHDVGMFVTHHRHVVEAIHIRQRLQIRFMLSQFLSTAVKQADMRISPFNYFTVQFQNQAQHAVCGWVLRPKIHGVIFYFSHDKSLRPCCQKKKRSAKL